MKTIILLLLSACCLPMQAQQTYHGMFSEGKTWNYKFYHYEDSIWYDEKQIPHLDKKEFVYDVAYIVEGDTIINGETYKRLYRHIKKGNNEPEAVYYNSAWRESNFQVYCVARNETNATKIYDFTMKLGDELETFEIARIDTLKVQENMYMRYSWRALQGSFRTYDYYWVEGIGGQQGLFNPYAVPDMACLCDNEYFESCYDHGECIFNWSDFEKEGMTNSIETIQRGNIHTDHTIYDLSGRRADGKKPGIYIRGGKKVAMK